MPTPESPCQEKATARKRDLKHTNVSSLDHADIISPIPDTTYTLPGMLSNKASDVSLLRRRAPARYDSGELGSNLYELVREQVQTELEERMSFSTF